MQWVIKVIANNEGNGVDYTITFPQTFNTPYVCILSDTIGIQGGQSDSEGTHIRNLSKSGVLVHSEWENTTAQTLYLCAFGI